jgi:hypothetical protein
MWSGVEILLSLGVHRRVEQNPKQFRQGVKPLLGKGIQKAL